MQIEWLLYSWSCPGKTGWSGFQNRLDRLVGKLLVRGNHTNRILKAGVLGFFSPILLNKSLCSLGLGSAKGVGGGREVESSTLVKTHNRFWNCYEWSMNRNVCVSTGRDSRISVKRMAWNESKEHHFRSVNLKTVLLLSNPTDQQVQ